MACRHVLSITYPTSLIVPANRGSRTRPYHYYIILVTNTLTLLQHFQLYILQIDQQMQNHVCYHGYHVQQLRYYNA